MVFPALPLFTCWSIPDIFITKGMYDIADSEDALAAIIAHEIAHIQLKFN